MSLRQGVTATEEHKLKALISKGVTWDEIVALCAVEDERGNTQVPLLTDVDLSSIKKSIYDPLVARLDEAKEAGFDDIHSHEVARRNEIAKQKEEAGGEGFEKEEADAKAREAANNERVRGNIKDTTSGAGKPVDDLLGPEGKKGKK